jgi:hypothetical protein
MDIFEYGTRNGVRFSSTSGLVTIEDLWSLPLTSQRRLSLDAVAKQVNSELKEEQEESFVTVATTKNVEAQVKLDIVKHIISVRLEENAIKQSAAVNKAKKNAIADIIADKQNDALKEMTLEQLTAEYNK